MCHGCNNDAVNPNTQVLGMNSELKGNPDHTSRGDLAKDDWGLKPQRGVRCAVDAACCDQGCINATFLKTWHGLFGINWFLMA